MPAREQNPDSQQDTLAAAGIEPGKIVIEKISGKFASRPSVTDPCTVGQRLKRYREE